MSQDYFSYYKTNWNLGVSRASFLGALVFYISQDPFIYTTAIAYFSKERADIYYKSRMRN